MALAPAMAQPLPLALLVLPGAPLEPPPASRLDASAQAVWQQVREVVERLEVSHGPAGVAQVRMEFSAPALPGVQAIVQQVAGRVQVELIASSEASRRRLRTVIERELTATVDRLGRAVDVTLRSTDAVDGEEMESLHARA